MGLRHYACGVSSVSQSMTPYQNWSVWPTEQRWAGEIMVTILVFLIKVSINYMFAILIAFPKMVG